LKTRAIRLNTEEKDRSQKMNVFIFPNGKKRVFSNLSQARDFLKENYPSWVSRIMVCHKNGTHTPTVWIPIWDTNHPKFRLFLNALSEQ
jgi:hypothetical protein